MQLRFMCKSKIHRATVTGADLDYVGSIVIDADLMRRTDIISGERVSVWNVTNGERIETYALPGPTGAGDIIINGAAAHKFHERRCDHRCVCVDRRAGHAEDDFGRSQERVSRRPCRQPTGLTAGYTRHCTGGYRDESTNWRTGPRLRRRHDAGFDQVSRVDRRFVGGTVLAPEGLHAGLHDRTGATWLGSSPSSTSATPRLLA